MNFLFILLLFTQIAWAKNRTYTSEGKSFSFEHILERDEVIWGFDFLPDGRIILSERSGTMVVFDPKTKKAFEVKGVPKVNAVGQGGLLDVRVHPEFIKNSFIYFTFSEPKGTGEATTALARGVLKDQTFTDVKLLFSAHKQNDNDIHYGSRIEFDGKGHIFFSVGDRDNRDRAQDLSYHLGKMIRLNEDGTIPKDNPFVGKKDAKPEIWSLGHRSPQGLVMRPGTNELWEAEMGPRGGDEVNVVVAAKNYGWPVVTYGREYYGPKIGVPEKTGFQAPIAHWVPSISPSAMTFYTGDKFPQWKGNVFLATLSGEHLRRLVIDGQKVVKEEKLMDKEGFRFRNVRTGPDGYLYYSTDEGKLGILK
jgi:aldose sugar dehydrogenase